MYFLPISMPKDIDKYFFNRKKDIDLINTQLSMLKLDIPPQLLITGYRGVGKTFLLRKVLQDQPNEYLSVFIDLSDVVGREKGDLSEEEVLKELLKKINKTVLEYDDKFKGLKDKIYSSFKQLKLKNYDFSGNANIFDIPIPIISENYNKLSQFVIELPQKIVDSHDSIMGFIIVIDEFQLLKSLKNPDAFFHLIRGSTQKQFNVSYIFTGSISNTSDIINMINGPEGAFGGRLMQINIDPFSREETKGYIDEKANGLKFTDKGFEQFYKCTRGIPLYINTFSSILPKDVLCDEDIIKEGISLNIDYIAIMWIYVWGRLSKGEKDFIIFLLERDGAIRRELDRELGYSKSSVTRFIDSLLNKGIIKYDSKRGYVLADEMLGLWLKIKFKNSGYYPI